MDPLPDSFPESRDDISLTRRDRLVLYYLLGLSTLVAAYTIVYNLAMAEIEGVDQSLFSSFEFVVQTMTTTGYGQDSELWSHPAMFLFVSVVQISGIGIGFFTLRLIIIPLFSSADVNLDNRLTPKRDHVIVCEFRHDSEVLLEELEELGIEYVLISSDEDEARELSDEGYPAIHGSPQAAEAYQRAGIEKARAIITDAGSATVDTILTARSVRLDIEIITLTDDTDLFDIFRETGADSVLSPHNVLGHRLAEKVAASFSTELDDTVQLGEDFEMPVHIPQPTILPKNPPSPRLM